MRLRNDLKCFRKRTLYQSKRFDLQRSVQLCHKLHKNIEVHLVDVPATEFIRTISTTSQFLLPVPNDAANDIDYIIIDTHHYFDTTDRRVNNICHQRRLRRLSKACQRRSGEQSHIKDCQKWPCSECEMEGRARGGRDFNGRRAVCGCRRVTAVYERAKWPVFYRNCRIGRVCETNLKCRQCLAEVADLAHEVTDFDGFIRCEAPNNLLNKFHGILQWNGKELILNNDHIILRGCVLRNTEWCYGMVIFAGRDTKLMQNSGKSKFKRTNIDRLLNFLIIGVK
ncbi:hypothetical protein AGLY_005058 [Aphis glycines]|uniref:Uncharacterized protein n=1 Tax=Aphis glycines TaxID=307491 RepID=A0A6G0TWX8_APHGL|nr:hypothetical protein AGLY_005058 [Aphis glycines]